MTDKYVKTIPVKEEDFFRQILDLAHIFGWRVAHFRPARTKYGWRTAVAGDGAGFPDVVMVRDGRCIIAELKSEKGKLTKAQAQWLWELRKCPCLEVYTWRPRHLERIVEKLQHFQLAGNKE